MKIFNLTQHTATHEQLEAGVIDAEPHDKEKVRGLLTFDGLPDSLDITSAAVLLTSVAAESGCEMAMIGGAGFLMSRLEKVLKSAGIQPVYAFSKRVAVESVWDDGSVKKTSEFKHLGFVEV